MSTIARQYASTPEAGRRGRSGPDRFPAHAVAAGVLAGVLFLTGIVSLVGPVASDTPNQMAASLLDKRGFAVVALFGAGLAAMLGIWTISVLRSWLSRTVIDGGEQFGGAAYAGGLLAIAMALTGMVLFYGASYKLAAQGGSGALLGLVDAANGAMMLSKFGLAVLVAAVSVAAARDGRFPGWFFTLGYLATAMLIGSSVGLFTKDSFTQFGGPLDFGGTVPAGIWALLMMVLLARDRSSAVPVQ
jgi:hypothetical protein